MGYYDLTKEERVRLSAEIHYNLLQSVQHNKPSVFETYFEDEDTYIRKAAYLALGRIYSSNPTLRETTLTFLTTLLKNECELVRQTVVNAAGEIGMFQFSKVQPFFDTALHDTHHKVRNAVIGSLKKMSQKNPKPVLSWAGLLIKHPKTEIRREVCHGIELRGRTHPQDVLPILQKLEFEEQKRVRDTLVHVLGQISYKKGCLATVLSALQDWKDKPLIKDALLEIIDVHSINRYAKFTALPQKEVLAQISIAFKNIDFSA